MKEKERSFFKSLRAKVTVRMLGIALIPVIIVGVLALYLSIDAESQANDSLDIARTDMQEDVVGRSLGNQAQAMADELGDMIGTIMVDITQTGSAPNTLQLAGAFEQAYQAAGGGAAGNAAGNVAIQTVVSPPSTTLQDVTNGWLAAQRELATVEGEPALGEISIVSNSGIVLATAHEEGTSRSVGDDVSGETWLQLIEAQLDMGLPLAYGGSEQLVEELLLKLGFGMYVPNPAAPTDSAQRLGVVFAPMYMDTGTMAAAYEGKVEDSRVLCFTSSGLLADSANPARAFEFLTYDEWIQDHDDVEAAVVEAIASDLQEDATAAASGYVIVGDDVAGYYQSESIGGLSLPGVTGIAVMLSQPQSTAFASLSSLETLKNDLSDSTNTLIIVVSIVFAVVLVIAILVSFILSRGITGPIAELRDVADKVSLGDLDVTLPEPSADEIGDLTESFGRMVTAVRYLSQEEGEGGQS